ncbi:MAG: osmotically inducible protein OsmC [Flavobacteriaceae bacterium]|nr:MAG: osmotically inducible protein OsmC [Flavobacteriaceae bacterium]
MKLTLERLDDALHFVGKNEKGLQTEFGASALGGESKALSPMEHLLLSAAACSSIDVVLILKKMKQELRDIKVEVSGVRRDEEPKIFVEIELKYTLFGDLELDKAQRATSLAVEKYCSVLTMLQHDAKISHQLEILP